MDNSPQEQAETGKQIHQDSLDFKMAHPNLPLCNIDDFSTITNNSKSTIYGWVCNRKVKSFKFGKKLMFRFADIEAFMLRAERKAANEY